MDFLASLNVEDLPEQQTRMLHLLEAHPDFQLRLGFDACCACGKDISTSVACRNCHRVRYCSEQCRHEDANVVPDSSSNNEDEEGGGETALGHSAVVCSLLKLCNDDDAVDDKATTTTTPAAMDRVRSEYESYPATLANVLTEGPCFQNVLQAKDTLVVHVVGASHDAELSQGPTVTNHNDSNDNRGVCDDYAEACAELADRYRLERIVLVFVGPECPEQPWDETRPMANEKSVGGATISIVTVKGIYNAKTLSLVTDGAAVADIIVFFNPGFTVPEYEHWKETLQSIPAGTPFLSTTNTEMEGIADCQFLLDQDRIQTLPPGMADILGVYSTGDDESSNSFFAVNPFAGSRVRQSGTMANDLYVKNRWMLGAVMGSFDPSKKETSPSKKVKGGDGSSNCKSSNPALI